MIFNSLGSNYDFKFVVKSLFSVPHKNDLLKLKDLLSKKYEGEVLLLYKSREAIKVALTISGLSKGSKVGVNGFTCYVVNQAITEAGYTPVYLDIGKFDLNFDIKNLENSKDIKALIIQNTLGYPLEIEKVKAFCNKNNILIIEDLAHCAGSIYSMGEKAGTVGDFTTLSFSQDKAIDAVSGGALIVRNNKFVDNLYYVKTINVSKTNQIRDRFYPLFTYAIRRLYPLGLGRYFHFIVKKLKLLSDPMGAGSNIKFHSLPKWNATMTLISFNNLSYRINHRKEIARVYIDKLSEGLLSLGVIKNCNLSTNIRFPIFVDKKEELINYLKNNGVFISDTWYDAPIAPKKLIKQTQYKNGECPNAEINAKIILNLPTHINVRIKDAEKISELINKWLNMKR